jgi:hypothetical protein
LLAHSDASARAGYIAYSHVEAAVRLTQYLVLTHPRAILSPEWWSGGRRLGFGSALRRLRAIVPAPDPWKQWKLALLTHVSGLTTDPCGTDAGQSRPALECKVTPAHEGDLGTELQVDCDWGDGIGRASAFSFA